MKVQVKYQEGEKFIAQVKSHQIVVDQPKEKGGTDMGMNPLEIFLSSLGSCVAVYAKRYCQGAKIDISGLAIEVESELSQDKPIRFKDIKVKINLSQDIGDKKESLIRFVRNCPIHNSITGQPNIEIGL